MITAAPFTAIRALPAVVERWRESGKKLNVMQIAREAGCSDHAARHYLRRLGIWTPKREDVRPRSARGDGGKPPTPDEIKAEAERIKAENIAARARLSEHYGYGVGPYVRHAFKDPRRLIG